MLRRIRAWYKVFFCIDLTCELTRLIVVVVVGFTAATVLLARRDLDQVLPILGQVLGAIALLGFTAWVYHDAPKAVRTIRQQRQKHTDADTNE
jgi:hypothetical protein